MTETKNNAVSSKETNEKKNNNLSRRDGYSFFSPFLNLFDIPDFFGGEEVDVLRTDIKDEKDHFLLEMEVPGIDKKNIKVAVKNGYLVVNAKFERTEENSKESRYVHSERESGSFTRSFYVGEHLKTKDVQAKVENGILLLSVPKKTEKDEAEDYVEIQ